MSDPRAIWTTRNEMDFIKDLGIFCVPHETGKSIIQGNPKPITRKDLLAGYINGWMQRKDWGTIDAVVVLGFANLELAREL